MVHANVLTQISKFTKYYFSFFYCKYAWNYRHSKIDNSLTDKYWTLVKFSLEKRLRVVELLKTKSQQTIAEEVGISRGSVRGIARKMQLINTGQDRRKSGRPSKLDLRCKSWWECLQQNPKFTARQVRKCNQRYSVPGNCQKNLKRCWAHTMCYYLETIFVKMTHQTSFEMCKTTFDVGGQCLEESFIQWWIKDWISFK